HITVKITLAPRALQTEKILISMINLLNVQSPDVFRLSARGSLLAEFAAVRNCERSRGRDMHMAHPFLWFVAVVSALTS
ncbi:MAG: hypothetical protein K2X81_20015, partial [Candidatus Obscuribacterales bacterium]|nr:hypothetical protein [Candidatus Obscuribacterales bacterium]